MSQQPDVRTTRELEAARRVVEAAKEWRDIIYGANRDVPAAKAKLDEAIEQYEAVCNAG